MKLAFTKTQWERVSEILGNLGILTAGSIILPFILERLDPTKIVWGIVITSIFWYASIIFAKKY